MATTSTLRREYPDLIVSTSGPRCDFSKTVGVVFPAAGPNYPTGRVTLRVLPEARQAFRALAAVMLHFGYAFVETAGGTLACRYIGGTSSTSLHAHGIAGDWNPSKNRYRVQAGPVQFGRQTDMPYEMVLAIERLRTVSGAVLLQWGGRWSNIKDPMHYELDCLRRDLATGVNLATLPAGAWAAYLNFENGTTTPNPGEDQVLDTNSPPKSPAVAMFQRDLIAIGYDLGDWTPIQASLYPPGADGGYGGDTVEACKAFQADLKLTVTGKGDALTVALAADLARFSEHPRRPGGAIQPPTSGTTDTTARAAAAEASKAATAAAELAAAAKAGADRANRTLDKVRSE